MSTTFLNHPTEERVHVCGLADYEDGNAYEVACHLVPLTDAFTTALQLLHDSSDQVCIIDDDNYKVIPHTYIDLAPYSINISKGIHA